jgi:agmatinase
MDARSRDRDADVEGGFLALPEENRDPSRAAVHVLPVPYEATVSYGQGVGAGPRAILLASQQVELFDAELGGEPALSYGIHTLPSVKTGLTDFHVLGPPSTSMSWAGLESGEAMMEELAGSAEAALGSGKLLLSLGGEHGITPALVRGVCRAANGRIAVVQIDAHADLRDSYLGNKHSHACAMRRVLEETKGPIVQLGIRSFSAEEDRFIRENPGLVTVISAENIARMGPRKLASRLSRVLAGRDVYLTLDVDGLDPSVIPATGTPEPGGLSWEQACHIMRTVAQASRVIALDCVELAPLPGLHMAEFAAAKLLYKTLSWIMRERAG